MGKSPGKWIKGILFGKKTSKSNLSKGRELLKSASEKPARVSSKEPISALTDDAPLISNPVPGTVLDKVDNSSSENGVVAKSASDLLVSSSSTQQDGDMPTVSDSGLSNDPEKIKLELAATVVQAAFRSHQACRAFRTLKGIIRLQAIVRGHLVRRQAVATLLCMRGIVKFQAITRGRMVRWSSSGNGQCTRQSLVAKDAKSWNSCGSKYSLAHTSFMNAFVYKLLYSSPTAKPLHLYYGHGEPYSAWDWLVRWSISQFWAPNSKHNETHDSRLQTVETEQTKPKSNDWRVQSVTAGNDPDHADSAKKELKHKVRKLTSQPVKLAQDHPHTGNDKSKLGLKKTLRPVGKIYNEAEIDVQKPKRHPVKLSKSPINEPVEDLAEAISEHNNVKSSLELPRTNSLNSELNCHLASEEHPQLLRDKSQDFHPVNKDFKDDQIGCENYKSTHRTSLPAKHEDQDATPWSLTRLPSYMATTASSKAKAKGQVSPRFGQNVVDKNGLTRRHSLPSSTNGKLSSSSRVHRLVQANDREGIKVERSLISSGDVTSKNMHNPKSNNRCSIFC